MKFHRLFVVAWSIGLAMSPWFASSQDTQTTDSVKPNPTTKAVDAPVLPSIPLNVISRVAGSVLEADKLSLTKEKREELSAFITAHHQETSRLQRLQADLDLARLKSHRLQFAITELVDEANSKSQIKGQTFFSAEQLAKLRQVHRQEIQQTSFNVRKNSPLPNAIMMPPLDTILANNDLLSVLELPTIQQALAITDEQWQKIEVAKHDAYSAARQLVLDIAKKEAAPILEVDLEGQMLFEKLLKDTLQILNDKQRSQYHELVQERQKKFTTPPVRGEALRDFKLILPHGASTSSQTFVVGAESTIRLTLHSAFADPEVIQRLQLTETQQDDITNKLDEFNPLLAKRYQDQHRGHFQKEQLRLQKLREIVLAHNTESQKPLANLLTAEQHAQLKKECLKSLGLASIIKPEVIEQLQLTEEQSTFIAAQLKKPAPAMPNFGTPSGSFEAFKKQSDDFHRKMTEHHTTMTAAIWDKLTPGQRTQFEAMTGLTQPRKLSSSQ